MSSGGIAASVADRLVRLAKEQRRDHSFVLARYGIERLLWRLSRMPFSDDFIVKGATLFLLWRGDQTRPTKDLDLLGKGSPEPERLVGLFRSLCALDAASVDGLVFDSGSVMASRIKEEDEYEGVRLRLRALLGRTRIDIQIDVGFGDAVTPAPAKAMFPTLLGQPAPDVWVYPAATVVAEKLQAIVDLGIRTSRMKDFHDLLVLLKMQVATASQLEEAIEATFARRRTPIPSGIPVGLSEDFSSDPAKRSQWNAFRKRLRLEEERSLTEVVADLRAKVLPLFEGIRRRRSEG